MKLFPTLISINEFFAEKPEEKKEKEATKKENAAKIRKTAMETYGETKKRKKEEGDEDPSPPGGKRRSGTETIRFLMD